MADIVSPDVAEADESGKRAPRLRILHRGERYIVRFVQCSGEPWACVCFEYWKPEPTLEGEFSAEGFFRHRGLNAIGIMAASNDWFQDDEVLEAIAAIRSGVPGFRLIGYGGSMGGFAAINFSDLLGLAAVVAVIPQFSISAARAPYEKRWREEASRISFRHDRIDSIPKLTHGWIVFDPWCVDGRHVADIQKHHALTEVRVPFGGHAQMLMLQQADVYTGMFTEMLEERFDLGAFRRLWRVRRRQSSAFWLGFAEALIRRGQAQAALRAMAQARMLPHPDPAWFDLIEADAWAAAGDLPRARALAAMWRDDPAFGGPAAERLARWPAPEAVKPAARPAFWKRWRRR